MLNDRWLETAIEYKVEWEKELRRREALGISDLPEPLPHPDHVEIDFNEGTAKIIGPKTKEEKAAIDSLIENKDLLLDELREINEARESETDPKECRKLGKLWNEKLEFIGFLNKLSPKTDNE